MKSTGEVMGIHFDFAGSFAKSQFAAGTRLPINGTALLSVPDEEKEDLAPLARRLVYLGFKLMATGGTAEYLRRRGFEVETVNKVREGSPHIVDMLGQGRINLLINTPEGSAPLLDSRSIRLVANELNVPTFTTLAAAAAAAEAIAMVQSDGVLEIKALQDYHKG